MKTWEPRESFIDDNGVQTKIFRDFNMQHPVPSAGSTRKRTAPNLDKDSNEPKTKKAKTTKRRTRVSNTK